MLQTIHSTASYFINEALVRYSPDFDRDALWAIIFGAVLGIIILVVLTTTMGNAAAKQLDGTVLSAGTVTEGIVKAFVTAGGGTTKIKNKSETYVKYGDGEETLLWSYQHGGMFKKHTVVLDSSEKPVAIIITAKRGMASCTNFICRPIPSYDGQESLTDEELKNAGVKDTGGESVYKFAKIECSRTMTTAKCTYGLVTGGDTIKIVYEGEKLSSLSFRAIFKETNGTAIAKAYMPRMSMTPHLDAASAVDMLAIISMGYALAGDESSAGALAGAGVI